MVNENSNHKDEYHEGNFLNTDSLWGEVAWPVVYIQVKINIISKVHNGKPWSRELLPGQARAKWKAFPQASMLSGKPFPEYST